MSEDRESNMELQVSDDGEVQLQRLAGFAIDGSGDNVAYTPAFVEWLQSEMALRATVIDKRARDKATAAMESRVVSKLSAMRVGESIPRYELSGVEPAVIGSIREVAQAAAAHRCVPWAESFAVAAGVGRELWDEPCERWVELPSACESGASLIAVGVAGDSMSPYLTDGDVIIVDTGARIARNQVVVARRAEGYVVKHVTRMTRSMLELSSFNEMYEPFDLAREGGAVVGVVVARLTR